MRLIVTLGLVSAALCAILALAAGGARWMGRQRAPAPFPLPDADGCLVELCLLDLKAPSAWPVATLNDHPDVVSGSAYHLFDLPSVDLTTERIAFLYAPGGTRPKPVLLYLTAQDYTLSWDWRAAANPPLLRLGDVIVSLGAPDRVSLSTDHIIVHYPGRGQRFVVTPTAMGPGWARLAPGDAVLTVHVTTERTTGSAEMVYFPPSTAWRGFGVNEFENYED